MNPRLQKAVRRPERGVAARLHRLVTEGHERALARTALPVARGAGRVATAFGDTVPYSRQVARAHDRVKAAVTGALAQGVFAAGVTQTKLTRSVLKRAVDGYLRALEKISAPAAQRLEAPLRAFVELASGSGELTAEGVNAFLDVITRPAFLAAYGFGVNRDGPKPPVFLMPGFTANRMSLDAMRVFIEAAGHKTGAPNIAVTQVGHLGKLREELKAELLQFWEANGRQPVIVAGQSLGGRNAFDFLKDKDLEGKLVGAIPIVPPRDTSACRAPVDVASKSLLELTAPEHSSFQAPVPRHLPVYAIVSRTDGILKNQPLTDAPHAKVSYVRTGHVGVAFAGAALGPLLDALNALSGNPK